MIWLILVSFACVVGAQKEQPSPVISTIDGPIQGSCKLFENEGVCHFYGIPYAKPPIGTLRFEKPESVAPRSELYQATTLKPRCFQPVLSTSDIGKPMSEDCLYLNILLNQNALLERGKKKRPVMIFIPGSSFLHGSGADYPYLSETFVASQDVILVTINYRLNVFGFLYHKKYKSFIGNQGLWDQNLAMRWVKDNCANFGGDPYQVTVFGQDSGSDSIALHLTSPHASGLIDRAILQSGSGFHLQSKDNERVTEGTNIVLKRTRCDRNKDEAEIIKCLKDLDPKTLEGLISARGLTFSPVFETEYLPQKTQSFLTYGDSFINDADVLMGITRDDGSDSYAAMVPEVFTTPYLSYKDGLKFIAIAYKDEAVQQIADWYFGPEKDATSEAIREGLILMYADIFQGCSSFAYAKRFSNLQKKGKLFTYILNHRPLTSYKAICTLDQRFGVCHGDDLMFVFGVPLMQPLLFDDQDKKLSSEMMWMWTSFARTGTPQIPFENRLWPEYASKSDGFTQLSSVLLDSSTPKTIDTVRANFCLKNYQYLNEKLREKLAWMDRYEPSKQTPLDYESSYKDAIEKLFRYLPTEHL